MTVPAAAQPGDPHARPALNLDEAERCLTQYDSAIGPGGEKAWLAAQLARKVPALVAEVKRLRTRDHIAELAIAYVNEPEDTDVGRVTQLYHELEAAVRHMHAAAPDPR